MKTYKYLICLLLTGFTFACKEAATTESTGENRVTGKLLVDGTPLGLASVQIDDVLNWRTNTDMDGRFEISNVTAGIHTFYATKTSTTGEVVKQTATISVASGTTSLGEIQLPKPSYLSPLDSSSVGENGVRLFWTRSNDTDYREYKIYRKADPGLDETTGQLLFVTTSIADTQYVDISYSAGLTYYYRVFILSAYGKLGGSNMVSIKVPSVNLIMNSGFEISSNGTLPDGWTYIPTDNVQQYLSVDATEPHTGSRSIRLSLYDTSSNLYGGMHEGFIRQEISTLTLPKNIQYRFSFWTKLNKGKPRVYLVFSDNSWRDFTISSGSTWTQYSTTFTLGPNVENIKVYISTFEENREDFLVDCWVDDLWLFFLE